MTIRRKAVALGQKLRREDGIGNAVNFIETIIETIIEKQGWSEKK